MVRQFVDKWCEWGIHALILGVLIFGPLATGAVRSLDFLVIQGLTGGILALWLVRIWLSRRFRLLWPPVCLAVVAFVVYAVVRCQTAELQYVARQELLRVTVYAILFFAALNNLTRNESARFVAFALVALAAALSIFAIYQFASHYAKVWQFIKPFGYLNRGSGTYINPNHLGGFLEMILPLALGFTLLGRMPVVIKVILVYAALLILAGIAVSLSRGAIIAAGVSLIVFFVILLFERDFWLRSALMLAILLIGGIIFVNQTSPSQKRFDEMFGAGKMENERYAYWDIARQIWQKNVWCGAGPGHFDYESWAYRPPQVQGRPQYAHNDYWNTLADWGLVGLFLILATATCFYIGVFKTWPFVQRSSDDLGSKRSNKAAFVLGGSVGLLAIILHSFLDFNMQVPANAIVAVILLALVSGHRRFATERFWLNPGVTGKIGLTLVTLAALVFLAQQEMRKLDEHRWLERAKAGNIPADAQLTALKNAYATEPTNFETAYLLGEFFRLKSWQGNTGYQADAQEAIKWFTRAMELNPYDPFSPLRMGMCLDWLGKSQESNSWFERAEKLAPHDYFISTYEGWHFIQVENYPEAKKFLERSLALHYSETAADYLDVVNRRMAPKN